MDMSILVLLLVGALIGFVVGFAVSRQRIGCIILLIVPIAMMVYVGRWQAAHPESMRSTSALDFLFGPFWPSLGALAGFYTVRKLREWFAT